MDRRGKPHGVLPGDEDETMRESHQNHSRRNSGFSCHVPPHADRPEAVGDMVSAALAERYRNAVQTQAKRRRQIDEVLRARNASINQIASERARRRLLDFSRQQRATCYGLTEFRPGTFNAALLAEAKAEAQRKSHDMLRRAGIDRAALEKVHDAAARRVRRLTPQAVRPGSALSVSSAEDAKQALSGQKGSWFVKRPPFDGTYSWYQYHRYAGSMEIHHNIEVLEDPFTNITGRFGHFSQYWNYDAGSFDVFSLQYRTGIGFWYNPPSPGETDMWVAIKCDDLRADVWLDNEAGMSDSYSEFVVRFVIDVSELQGVELKTAPWFVTIEGDPDSKWYHMPILPDNARIWIPLRVNLPPGPVFIWVGAHDHHECFMDDMSTSQTMRTHCLLEEVHIAE